MTRCMLILLSVAISALITQPCTAFVPTTSISQKLVIPKTTAFVNNVLTLSARKQKEDLSYIESRDMTREEMLELNKKNEEIMNMELSMMTGFSLVISLPILYLCWVAFFSD
eukprot:CAMPEP_0195525042 /NCGR_PEP_ID=MMETSP0794_2-20130614/25234_1 /TAXON_ID=515487 /ORGANISM="Stephanopyxis turris, Strain CCMP 815" /LENGTH=111 /DNA_ID=CAMNT_0040655395 /DNA_START=52 /DNA_END=387 /DNA_ORIENTATION=-